MFIFCISYSFTSPSDGLNADGTISVFNANTVHTPEGEINSITGTATVPDPSEPGKLSVQFPGVPMNGDCKLNIEICL